MGYAKYHEDIEKIRLDRQNTASAYNGEPGSRTASVPKSKSTPSSRSAVCGWKRLEQKSPYPRSSIDALDRRLERLREKARVRNEIGHIKEELGALQRKEAGLLSRIPRKIQKGGRKALARDVAGEEVILIRRKCAGLNKKLKMLDQRLRNI